MEIMENKKVKWNLTREQITNEIEYYYNYSDILEKYKTDLYLCTDNDLVIIFQDIINNNNIKVEAQDIINKYHNDFLLIDTPDGYQEITDLYKKINLDCYELKTNNFNAKVSFNHLFEVNKTNNWVFVKDIKTTDKVLTKNGWENTISIENIGKSDVYDWSVQHDNHRYWANGISSHNTGKSFLCYSIAKEAQAKGMGVIYIDTEYAIEMDQLPGYGIDTSEDKFMLLRTNIIEDVKVMLTQLLDGLKEQKAAGKDVERFIIFIDSVGQLGSRKEVEDAKSGREKADFTKAKALASLFRIINSDLGYLGIPLVCTNHTYQCVTGETKVMLADGSFKEIKNIIPGEFIQTLVGEKEVNFTKKYNDATIYQVEMEDGTIIKCTNNHKFLIKKEWSEDENNECWKNAEDLTENDVIFTKEMNEVKVKCVTQLIEKEVVYDINVADVHHYILENGMVTHNTMDLYPQDVMKGGCLTAGVGIQTRDGIKNIEDIVAGDYVDTLDSWEEVLETHIFEKETIEFEFDNGNVIRVSKEHKFLVDISIENKFISKLEYIHDNSWKTADELNINDEIILKIDDVLYKTIIIRKTETNCIEKVYDLTVANSHHYIDVNGLIHHNSGLFYSASCIAYLSKAKLKEGEMDELDLGQSGLVVTAKLVKNRMAKPKKVKFEISFTGGCNKHVGLDFWCTAENFKTVGVAKGKMDGDKFIPGGNRWFIRHLGGHVRKDEFYSERVFTTDVLDALQPIIKEYFAYKSMTELNEIQKKIMEAKGDYEDNDDEILDVDNLSSSLFDDDDED